MHEYRWTIDKGLTLEHCLKEAWRGVQRRREFANRLPDTILFNPLDWPGKEEMEVAGNKLIVSTHPHIPRHVFALCCNH